MNLPIEKSSPMMAQWQSCKDEVPDAILFFRLGDFYETFQDDAVICSSLLDLTLTKRQLVPMSGMPAHAADQYIDKLVSKGYRVAIAEQVEDPRKTKGLVKRAITRIVTPGTVINSSLLTEKSNNYIASITQVGDRIGIAFFDVTCADCRVIEVDTIEDAENELFRFKPKELVTSSRMQQKHTQFFADLKSNSNCLIDTLEDWRFEHKLNLGFITSLLKVHSLDGFGLTGMLAAINAAGALLSYIQDHLKLSCGPLQAILPYTRATYLSIDKTSMRNLELIESQSGSRKHTLLGVIDHTKTPMGGRLLKRWVIQPLQDLDEIKARHDAVAELFERSKEIEPLQADLSHVRDLERMITKVHTGNATPRDFVSLKDSLKPLKSIKQRFSSFHSCLIAKESALLSDMEELIELIAKSLADEPPLRASDGGVFREGFNEELDNLRSSTNNSKTWMANYQTKIREETGIKTLKVGYTRVSGFYIEVSKGQSEKMPMTFKRRQTLTNAERFMTEELKAFEEKILTAEEKIEELEITLFQALKEQVLSFEIQVLQNARALATLDALLSLAFVAKKHRYARPEISTDETLHIIEGRHPVIEASSFSEKFIPNDTTLDHDKNQLMLITGPNMAGKSTYIRQVALIVILAQMGSFVPATSARIGLVDKVFTRIGASDDLSRGQSTFMVEMTETAAILHHASSRSLVILDEIGRGTSTYDGISLAWSIAEYLLTTPGKKAKTLFATHYFELTKLEEKIPGAVNYNVAVHESDEQIRFLRKIVRGGTDKSYGIHVARLAGLPSAVLRRAGEILLHLEENANQKNLFEKSAPKRATVKKTQAPFEDFQLRLLPEI